MITNLPVELLPRESCVAIQVGLLAGIQSKWPHRKDEILRQYLREDIKTLRFVRNHTLYFTK
jgi:hypothetical protein